MMKSDVVCGEFAGRFYLLMFDSLKCFFVLRRNFTVEKLDVTFKPITSYRIDANIFITKAP